jgi:hypothetical protein
MPINFAHIFLCSIGGHDWTYHDTFRVCHMRGKMEKIPK